MSKELETAAELKPRKGVYIRTFGCQMNEYDSLKLERILEQDFVKVESPQEAELILINTCSVREKPEHKLYSLLGELRELKSTNPRLIVGVGGCVAQQEGEAIIKRSKEVDLVFGTHNLSLVPSLLERRRTLGRPQVAVDYRDEWEDLPLGLSSSLVGESRVVAPVSISRGCNKNCTYCVVPTTRGPEVSRSEDEILREVRLAVHRGAKEILLLGQTVNSYGLDLLPKKSFSELIKKISLIEGLERIRFTSPHPQEVRRDFIELMGQSSKICRHIHMPLQSGSDRILKAMNRNYRRARYLRIIEELRQQVSELAISTDIIVGFPGETESDFEQTMEILNQVEFDSSYSFVFSPRPNTAAALIEDSVPLEIKLERLQRFQARQEEISNAKLRSYLGRRMQVLVDGHSEHDPRRRRGRISQNVVVHIEDDTRSGSSVDLDAAPALGSLVWVEVTEIKRHTLNGRIVA